MFGIFNFKKQKLVTDSSITESENEKSNICVEVDKSPQKSIERTVDEKNFVSDLGTLNTGPVQPILTVSTINLTAYTELK